ncbi:MAG: hypothetical protein KKF33_13245 [Alphaproteobacteria bacterium]|nr:hypothetical protein [Alphaproteobacteria bacterium]
MLEVGFGGLATFVGLALLATTTGLAIASRLTWQAGTPSIVPVALGTALGPFLLGIGTIIVLTFAGGQSAIIHLGLVILLLALPLAAARRPSGSATASDGPFGFADWTVIIALVLVGTALLFISVFSPLTQNDALEYASAARVVYEHNWISSYPALDPLSNKEGFYGPWTHPPLYVALIYLTDIMQGSADSPGLMRLLAPWFALSGSLAVFATARPLGRTLALVASLVFLSTPLLFLGAGSALLDALPISAFVLLILALVHAGGSLRMRGLSVGLVLGLALWTHSLAIVFIPLAVAGILIRRGVRNWRIWMAEVPFGLSVAVLVGGAYYVRNIALFGAPISDNPIVFAIPRLAWDEYFIINRGLDSAMATLQYGIFKGWFAFEAFGLSFWGMAVGVVALIWARRRTLVASVWTCPASTGPADLVENVLLGVLVTYYGGVVLSVLLGIDLMVKNERYLLSIQGMVAILCGYGYLKLVGAVGKKAGRFRSRVVNVAVVLLAVALVGQSALFVQYSLARNGLTPDRLGENFQTTLSRNPDYQLMDFLRQETPDDAVVFSLKPSDMYYSDRRQIGYLDPRLVPFYAARTAADGAKILKALGVDFIHVPPYGLPPIYNSVLIDVIRDRNLTALRMSNAGGQIYQLVPDSAATVSVFDITPGQIPWSREVLFELGGRKRLSSVGSGGLTPLEGNTSNADSPLGLFQRSLLTLVRTGSPDLRNGAVDVAGSTEIAVDLSVGGRGLISVLVVEYDSEGAVPLSTPLGTFELSQTYPEMHYNRRMLLRPGTTSVSVVVQQQGRSKLTVRNATVSAYHGKARQ